MTKIALIVILMSIFVSNHTTMGKPMPESAIVAAILKVTTTKYAASHLTYKQIKEYAKVINKVAIKHQLDPKLIVAIVRQESNFGKFQYNSSCGLTTIQNISPEIMVTKNNKIFIKKCVITDIGFTQINYANVQRLKLDMKRLTTDFEYSLEALATIMEPFKAFKKAEPKLWWARYNVGIGTGYRTIRSMKAYYEDVMRYYIK